MQPADRLRAWDMKLDRPKFAALIAMSLCCPPAAARKVDAAGVPIIVVGAVSTAACPGGGDVVGFDPQGDNFLSVRSGPGGGEFIKLDRIHTGQHLEICDMSGPWFAVAYDPDGDTGSCDVDRPWAVRQAYAGRCRQGWIYSRYEPDGAVTQSRERSGVTGVCRRHVLARSGW